MTKANLHVKASDFPGMPKAIGVSFRSSILGMFHILLCLVFWFVTIYALGAETSLAAVKNH